MHLQILAITINPSLIGHDRYYEAGFGAPHAPTRSCPMGQKIFKNGQRTGSSGKHRIWCGIAEQKDVQPLRWSVPHWLLAPGSEVLLSGRFSTLPTLLRIFMLMMREIGERVLCGKRWNSVSLCCKRFEGSAAVDNAPPQTNLLSFEKKLIFYLQFVQNPHKETPFLSGTIRVQSGRTAPRELLPKTCKRRQE